MAKPPINRPSSVLAAALIGALSSFAFFNMQVPEVLIWLRSLFLAGAFALLMYLFIVVYERLGY